MIVKLRHRLVLLIMLVVTLSVVIIFSFLYASTRSNLEEQSAAVLERISESQIFAWRPGGDGDIQAPYFCVWVNQLNEVTLERTSFEELDSSMLLEIVAAALASGQAQGHLDAYSLRYQITGTLGGVRLAFVDTSLERSTLRSLVVDLTLLGIGILAAFFVLSLFMSKRLVKPIETAWEQQRQFVADASHELKTPLTVILANTELLENAQTGDSAHAQERKWLENIGEEGARMRRLIETLLDQARADSADSRASFSDVDWSYLVNERVLMFEPVIYESGRRIESEIAENVHVSGNADMLEQLAAILIDNAGKYSPPGSTIRVALCRAGRKYAALRVYNEGPAIPEADREKIFTRFYRADEARQSNGSYGLGLSIAKSIAQLHGGTITAGRELELTVFTVSIPLIK